MGLLRKWESFRSTEPMARRLFVKAWLTSGFVRFTLRFLPFSRVLAWKGSPGVECPEVPHPDSLRFRLALKRALVLCDRYAPWGTECYTRALTGKILLNRAGLPGTVYVGFSKKPDGRYEGHAWLRSYDSCLTGADQMHLYTVHTFYT
jgi:hypothetical protein